MYQDSQDLGKYLEGCAAAADRGLEWETTEATWCLCCVSREWCPDWTLRIEGEAKQPGRGVEGDSVSV